MSIIEILLTPHFHILFIILYYLYYLQESKVPIAKFAILTLKLKLKCFLCDKSLPQFGVLLIYL